MTWNYRVVKQKNGFLAIYEAYYDDNGKPISISCNRTSPEASDIEELTGTLELMLEAINADEEILNYVDFN